MTTSLLRRKYNRSDVTSSLILHCTSQYLVEHKYAGAGQVAINGGSNGGTYTFWIGNIYGRLSHASTGLLVAACVNRAPEGTFGAAVAEVGVLDLLKVRQIASSRT